MPNNDRATLDYYNQEARKYREIHRRPIQRYTETLEKEAFRPYLVQTNASWTLAAEKAAPLAISPIGFKVPYLAQTFPKL